MGILSFVGCSGAVQATHPETMKEFGITRGITHSLLGMYTFVIDPALGTIDIIPLRESALHLNALKFLEPPPNLHLSLVNPPQINGNILDVDIGLRNPYLGLDQFTGFDVCGIFITHGSLSGFHDPDLIMPGDGDTRLLNPDGYTRWWNPSEFPHGETIFCYKDGLLGTPALEAGFNCTINGYKYFADDLEANDPLTSLATGNRGMFSSGQQNVRHYSIDLSGGLIFNYAVDACWAIPQGDIPYDIPDDFPQKANRSEAYNVIITELENSLYHDEITGISGGRLKLQIDTRDHFNAQDNVVYVESLAALPYEEADQLGGGDDSCMYEVELVGYGLIEHGSGELLITVQSEAMHYGGLLPDEPVCSYFTHTFTIADEGPKGWARTWGSEVIPPEGTYPNYMPIPDETANHVVADDSGNAFTVGYFTGTVDFDAGPPLIEHTSNGYLDTYLVKYNAMGQLQWVRAWGGDGYDRGRGVALDNLGNIYVTGDFIGTVDFDPGPGIVEFQSHGTSYGDSFLSKFSPDGQHQWTKVWGGAGASVPYQVAVDKTGDLFIVGEYLDLVDFDPGPGIDNHLGSTNWFDSFILKLDANGDFLWVRTWGDYGRQGAVNIDFDSFNDIYIVGNFTETADFDPGLGEEIHTAHDYMDIYLSKFNQMGEFQWVRTWGGDAGRDQAPGLCVSSTDDIYITGRFVGTVDMNPGPEVNEYTGTGSSSAFLSKFDTNGIWQWTRAWGGSGIDKACGVVTDDMGGIILCGTFMDTVDFDPGDGVLEFTSSGGRDSFLSYFNLAGDLQWALTWGGESAGTKGDRAESIALDAIGHIFVSGSFEGIIDSFPGPDVDEHVSHGGTDSFLAMFPPGGNW